MTVFSDKIDFGGYTGATVGIPDEERWQYEGVGYNATKGIFYVGTQEVKQIEIVPFALRQCKEVEGPDGAIHRYPVKTRRAEMVTGDPQPRVQVVGLVNGQLRNFGGKSWTVRAFWLNPRSGEYHSDQFPVGTWYRLQDYIKDVKAEKKIATAPLNYRLTLTVGASQDLASAANPRQKMTAYPIVLSKVEFVGPDEATENEALYVSEGLDEWVAEWNKRQSVAEAEPGDAHEHIAALDLNVDDVPF